MNPTDHDRRVAEEAAYETRAAFKYRTDDDGINRVTNIILAAADKIAEERMKELAKESR